MSHATSFGVWLLASVVLMPANLIGVTIHDEGFIATGAMLILHGKLPYRDFLSFYGPAQYYVVAFLFAIFGQDLLVLRLAHVAWLGALAVAVGAVCRRIAAKTDGLPIPPRYLPAIGIAASMAIALYAMPTPAYPAVPATVLLLLASLSLFEDGSSERLRSWLIASGWVGVAGLFRWDFGIYGLAALLLALLLALWSRQASLRAYLRHGLMAVGPATLILLAGYVPFLGIASDPRRWYHEIVEYSMYEFPKWRARAFLRPAYWGFRQAVNAGDLMAAFDAACRLAYVIIPAGLSLTLLVFALRQAWRGPRRSSTVNPAIAYAIFLCLFLLQQMRIRGTTSQGFPMAATAIPLALYAFVSVCARWPTPSLVARTARALALCGLAVVAMAALSIVHPLFTGPLVPLDNERAHLIRLNPEQAYYGEVLRYVRAHTSKTDVIFSGALDHSKLFINDSLIYFLTERLPADRFVEFDPGIVNTAQGQREITEMLQAKRVPLLVLLAYPIVEPNLTASSNGVHELDDFIRRHYVKRAGFGGERGPHYTILEPLPMPPSSRSSMSDSPS